MLWWWPFGRVPEIEAGEFHKLVGQQGETQIVDVRTRLEWERGHIEGAQSVPIHTLKRSLPQLGLVPNRPVVAHMG